MVNYLFRVSVVGGSEAVALADDGRVSASADGVELPVRVVVVDDVDESPPCPRHALDEPNAESVEGDRHLHDRVLGVGVVRSQEHHLHACMHGHGHGHGR